MARQVLLVVALLLLVLHSSLWVARRHALRARWHEGRLTVGQFLDATRGMPPWLDRSTAWRGSEDEGLVGEIRRRH